MSPPARPSPAARTRRATGPAAVVLGTSLGGIAAALRLAKLGHAVTLVAPDPPATPEALLPESLFPEVVGFPAPVRDLFRKSGRAFDAELSRTGSALVPAPPVTHRFADGAELVLPTERGDQATALTAAYGASVAARWRDLLDSFDRMWQTLRPLGWEGELVDKEQLTPDVRRGVLDGRTVADLAEDIGHPHLAAVITAVAWRQGSDPERTPAHCALPLALDRKFGRWTMTRDDVPAPATTLVEALRERIRTRRITTRIAPVDKITVVDGTATGVLVGAESEHLPAAAVVNAADPWRCYADWLPTGVAGSERRGLRRSRPAHAPVVTQVEAEGPPQLPIEVVEHDGLRLRTVSHDCGDRRVLQDWTRAAETPAAGIAWRGRRSWLWRPPVRSRVSGLFHAGPWGRGGGTTAASLLSGALAAAAVSGTESTTGAPIDGTSRTPPGTSSRGPRSRP